MAGSFNKVMLMGNLTRDVELRQLPNSGNSVGGFGLAVNRTYRTQSGEQREEVTFVDCEAFGRTAEVMSQYLNKGRPVFIEGRLKLDQWQDQQGNNRSKLKVIVENFQFVDSRTDGGGGEAVAAANAPTPAVVAAAGAVAAHSSPTTRRPRSPTTTSPSEQPSGQAPPRRQ